MTSPPTIGLLGTGLLGKAVAQRLRATGHSVIAYNRTREKALPLVPLGVQVVEHPWEALAGSECILLLLADNLAIRAVLQDPRSRKELSGRTVIQMGTIGSDQSLDLQREVEEAGGRYLEAPVLGSIAEALSGTLLVMVGGQEEQFIRWKPVLASLAPAPRLIGPVGSASALKLALNYLIAAEIAAFSLALGLVQRSTVSVDDYMHVLRQSALFAPMFQKKLPRLLARQYGDPNFSTEHLLKDLDLFLSAASRLGLECGAAEGIRPLLLKTISRNLRDADYSSLFEVINPSINGRSL
ncbi:MAG TPA: NAD(P)-dependent oxidoreductase [Nitrospira sp.]|nr:NAD(P)-dependent oxidoreductase [Nitrospira sp.]